MPKRLAEGKQGKRQTLSTKELSRPRSSVKDVRGNGNEEIQDVITIGKCLPLTSSKINMTIYGTYIFDCLECRGRSI